MTARRKSFSITLDEELVREAKKRALDERKPLYLFVEDALRLALNQVQESTNSEHPAPEKSRGIQA